VADLVLPGDLPFADRMEVFASRDEHMAARDAGEYRIGASTVPEILGTSSYGSPWDVFLRKRHPQYVTRRETAATRRGQAMEGVVIAEYAEETGAELLWPAPPKGAVIVRGEAQPWLAVSPDHFVRHEGVIGGLEVKNYSNPDAWGETGTVIERYVAQAVEVIPAHVLTQVYASLAATGLPWWDVAVLFIQQWELRTFRVLADEKLQGRLMETIEAWRERHLVQGIEPPVDGTSGCTKGLRMHASGLVDARRTATETEQDLITSYVQLGAEMKTLGDKRDRTRNEILRCVVKAPGQERRLAMDDGSALSINTIGGRESVMLSALRKDRPDLYEAVKAAGYINSGEESAQVRVQPPRKRRKATGRL